MEVTSEIKDDVAIYRIVGRIDASTSPNLESAVRCAFDGATALIIFDMREVSFVSSAGLRVVVMTAKQAAASKAGFVIFGPKPEVNEVFEISGLQKVISITEDETQAHAMLGRVRGA